MLISVLAAETAVETSTWTDSLDEVVLIFIKLFGLALIVLATWAVNKFGKKLGLENTEKIAEVTARKLREAINLTEAWAHSQDEKPKKESKLEFALDYFLELDKKAGVTEDIRNQIKKQLEAELFAEKKAGKHISIEEASDES